MFGVVPIFVKKLVLCIVIVVIYTIAYPRFGYTVPIGWFEVVDDLDSGYSETGKAWVSYSFPGAVNDQYRYLSHLGHTVERKGTASWQLAVPVSGRYRVDIHYRPTENRTRDADFFVYEGNGVIRHYSVDQTYGGPISTAGWLSLGSFTWSAGQKAKVLLDGTDDNDSDEADAVRWTLVEKKAGAVSDVPIIALQQLLLNNISVNLTGKWLETGAWHQCSDYKDTSTRLDATLRYFNGRYTFEKEGQVQEADCGKKIIDNYVKDNMTPTDKLVSRGSFKAMMQEIFPRADQIDILHFSQDIITYRIYHADGIRTRAYTRQ